MGNGAFMPLNKKSPNIDILCAFLVALVLMQEVRSDLNGWVFLDPVH